MINLLGLASGDPKARIARQIVFAQGQSTGRVPGRAIVLVANKIGGTEIVETINGPIQDSNDGYARFGRRSALMWMYRTAIMVAPQATIYGIAVAEGASATAASVTFTFATTADAVSTISVQWGTKNIQVGVAVGDTPTTQALNVSNAILADKDVPFSSSPSAGVVTITCSNNGPRGSLVLTPLRMVYLVAIATTVTKSSITAGTVADDVTNALTALGQFGQIYYHVLEATATSGVTSSDGGVGQYSQFIATQSLPANGKDQQFFVGMDGTQSQGTTVATSSAFNNPRGKLIRVHGNDWTPGMVAAHSCGAHWLMESQYAGASMTGYTTNSAIGTIFNIPDPFNKANRPTATEISADLNNGVVPVEFLSDGTARFNRSITSYSVLPGTSSKDYNAREGHIPSVIDYAWEYLFSRWQKNRQANVMDDLPKGKRPLPNFNTPGGLKAVINSVIDVLSSTVCPSNNTPILDPSPDALQRMRDSVYVEKTNNGLAAAINWEPVRHDNQDDFLIRQTGADT